jgi:hypothetical protein
VEPRRQSPTHDPELDPPRPAAGATATDWPPPYCEDFQRLVTNPFLALVGLIVLLGVLRQALEMKSLPLFVIVLCGLLPTGFLLQYHCRDCGATGLLFRWRSHACPSVLVRHQSGRARAIRGPNPYTQLLLWIYLLIAGGIVVALMHGHVVP